MQNDFILIENVSHEYSNEFDKKKVIYIKAKRVKIELKPVFVEIDDSDTDSCWLDMKCHQTNDTNE